MEQELIDAKQTRKEVEILKGATHERAALIREIQRNQDDLENRSRRDNLLLFGIPDTPTESWNEAESKELKLSSETLKIKIDSSLIDRAHRIGRFTAGKQRPIIMKFNQYKTKQHILSCAPGLKATSFSINEDFSNRVVQARKQLLEYAKRLNVKGKLKYDKIYLNDKSYCIDEATKTVIECAK